MPVAHANEPAWQRPRVFLGALVEDGGSFDGKPMPHVSRLIPGSALEKLGIKEGDQLAQLHGTPLTTSEGYRTLTAALKPGDALKLTVVHEGVRAFGASVSKSVGSWNLAAEASVRRNTALVAAGGLVVDVAGNGDNAGNPLYPVGNSAHLQVSAIHTLERSALWDGGLFLGEIAWHRRTSVTKNEAALDPNSTRDASALRFILQPTYYQAASGLDLSVPIGVGLNLSGRSSVITVWNGTGGKGNGDISIGLAADYLQTWKAGITYTKYVGSSGAVLDAAGNYSFKQSLKDRDFLSLSVQRTF